MSMKQQAAAVIVRTLKKKNHQSTHDLRAVLASHGFPAHYLALGARVIRDTYGQNFLTCNTMYVYTLDPSRTQGLQYTKYRARDDLTRAKHLQDGIEWLIDQYGNKGILRTLRKDASRLVEDFEDVLDIIAV